MHTLGKLGSSVPRYGAFISSLLNESSRETPIVMRVDTYTVDEDYVRECRNRYKEVKN